MFAQSSSDRTFADRPVTPGTLMLSCKRNPSLLLPASGEKNPSKESDVHHL